MAAMAGGVQEPKLYVKNLPSDIDEDELRQVFGIYGKIVDIVFLNRATPERPERSAFVLYEDQGSSSAAMVVLSDMYKFREDTIPITCLPARPREDGKGGKDAGKGYKGSWNGGYSNGAEGGFAAPAAPQGMPGMPAPPAPPAPPSAPGAPHGGAGGGFRGERGDQAGKLWVGNIPAGVSDGELKQTFGRFGEITEVNVLPSKSRSGQLCAFVTFAERTQADAALQAMAGFEMRPGEGELKVERPGDRPRGGGGKGKDFGGKGDYGKGGGGYGYDNQKGGYGGGKGYKPY